MDNSTKKIANGPEALLAEVGRRRFLRYAGFSVAMSSAILAACENRDTDPSAQRGARTDATTATYDLGAGDIGILNYAYTLEQLETAFYNRVVASPYSGITNAEFDLIREVRDHELVHTEFFKAALGSAGIPQLTFVFPGIDFTDRQAVLNAARQFEDVGISAYNGAGRLLTDPNNLVVAGKIVSVEARHAALFRTLLLPVSSGLFAGDDVIDANGLDVVRTPQQVLPIAQQYITDTITATRLPMM
jgi:hypothetical protein